MLLPNIETRKRGDAGGMREIEKTENHPKKTILVEIHRSRGAPLNDYNRDLQKSYVFSILSLW